MAQTHVKVKLDQSAITGLLTTTTAQSARKASTAIVNRARANARVDSGKMRDSIRARQTKGGIVSEWSVRAFAPYSSYQEKGTRAHGPVRAKFLVFTPKGSSTVVFAKRVRGVTASHFMQRAIDATTLADFLP